MLLCLIVIRRTSASGHHQEDELLPQLDLYNCSTKSLFRHPILDPAFSVEKIEKQAKGSDPAEFLGSLLGFWRYLVLNAHCRTGASKAVLKSCSTYIVGFGAFFATSRKKYF